MMKKIYSGPFLLAIIVTVCVTVIVGYGLFISGSPQQERMRRLDAQRLNDLQSITYAIDQFYAIKFILPTSLAVLQQTREVYLSSISDPESQTPYEYKQKDADTYQLCATFQTIGDQNQNQYPNAPTPAYRDGTPSGFWKHDAGRTCYTIDVRIPSPPAMPIK